MLGLFSVVEDFDMDVVQLSEEELLQKHRRERKELQGKYWLGQKLCCPVMTLIVNEPPINQYL